MLGLSECIAKVLFDARLSKRTSTVLFNKTPHEPQFSIPLLPSCSELVHQYIVEVIGFFEEVAEALHARIQG